MSIQQQVFENLKSEGLNLNDADLQSVIQLLNFLAKIEYEVYRQQKSKSNHGNSKDPQDISINHKDLAA